jgi:hypothetical protein
LTNTIAAVSEVLAVLRRSGAPCDLFGGWAEELLGLRKPGPHNDIDLIYRGPDFGAVDRALGVLGDRIAPIAAKCFHHKRAFLHEGIVCEIFLVEDWSGRPFTMFWGDTKFAWEAPLLHPAPVAVEGRDIRVVSADNLRKYRRERGSIGPRRWSDPALVVPAKDSDQLAQAISE